MDTVQAIVALLMLLNFTDGHDMSTEVMTIKEGSTVTLNCSEEHNETIWYVAWAVLMSNGSREAIATCYDSDEDCRECNKENVLNGAPNCTVYTELHMNAFTSQLTLRNVPSHWRQAVIECIMKDIQDPDSDEFLVMKSYDMNVYRLSDNVKCTASLDVDHAMNVSCQVPLVYPDVICRIFPEHHENIYHPTSKSPMMRLPELLNVTQFKKQLERNKDYYEASCTSKYYPNETGRYQFHVVMYTSKDSVNPIANITTNSLEIKGVPVYYKHSEKDSSDSLSETSKAFYALMGSILILGVSVFLIISWVIWTKRGTCFSSPSVTVQNNEYESIPYNVESGTNQHIGSSDEGYGESTGGDVVVSDSDTDEETYPQKLLEERGYVPNVTVPKEYTVRTATDNIYIDPVTPTSALSRSLEERSNPDLTINEDNYNETHSKQCL